MSINSTESVNNCYIKPVYVNPNDCNADKLKTVLNEADANKDNQVSTYEWNRFKYAESQKQTLVYDYERDMAIRFNDYNFNDISKATGGYSEYPPDWRFIRQPDQYIKLDKIDEVAAKDNDQAKMSKTDLKIANAPKNPYGSQFYMFYQLIQKMIMHFMQNLFRTPIWSFPNNF